MSLPMPSNFPERLRPKGPCHVYWSQGDEHYHAICSRCEWDSGMTCDRWEARRWAIEHECKESKNA